VPSPNGTSRFGSNILDGVSCASEDACTAVGYHYGNGFSPRTLIESWDGTRWSVVPSPSPTTSTELLDSVSCASEDTCTAAGVYDNVRPGGGGSTLIESWDGTRWSVIPSPSPGSSPAFSGVSCVTAAACTAVGSYDDNGVTSKTLIESWDGTKWSVVPSPNPGTSNVLGAVSCAAADACTAAGNYANGAAASTLIESWNGTRWSVVPSPNPGGSNVLGGVSCASAGACTAAGNTLTPTGYKTLIESRTASG